MSAFLPLPAANEPLGQPAPVRVRPVGFLSRLWRALLASLAAASLIAAAQAQGPDETSCCSTRQSNPQGPHVPPSLIGTWRADAAGGELRFKFASSGKFEATVTNNGSSIASVAGTYYLKGSQIQVHFQDGGNGVLGLRWEHSDACFMTWKGRELFFTRVVNTLANPAAAEADMRLVGLWQATAMKDGKLIVMMQRFDADGKYSFVRGTPPDKIEAAAMGTYTHNGDQAQIHVNGQTYTDTIAFLSADQFTIGNDPLIWTRVR